MPLVTETLRVQGMRCNSCEDTVERALRHLRGVASAKADFGGETVVVTYDTARCNPFQMAKALELKGYECSQPQRKPRPLREALRKFLRIALGILGILAIFYVGTQVPALDFLPGAGQQASLGLLFVAGLLTGFHCVGMCGGFVLGYAGGGRSRGLSHLAYGLGKTLSYTAIGALFGGLGALVSFTPELRGAAAAAAGVFLLVFGLNMLHWLPRLRFLSLPTPRWLARFVGAGVRQNKSPFVVGLLNGLMIACGPLQAMYVMAAGTGSPLEGAKLLFAFGTGTLPLMLGFGFLTSLISRQAGDRILKASGFIVLALGLIMVNRGLILAGAGYDFASLAGRAERGVAAWQARRAGAQSPPAARPGGQQIARMEVLADGYQPSSITLRRGVPVRWVIRVKELNECNRSILVPKLGLAIDLHEGEQTVEFTPAEAGVVPWSCAMGMLRGEFLVVDDAGPAPAPEFVGPPPPPR